MRVQQARATAILAMAMIGMLAAVPAFAQKVKTPRPPRPTKNTTTSTPTAGRTALPITFASWLDDASTLERGVSSVSISMGRWSARDGGQTDGPVFDVSAGVSKRVQLGVSVPFYHASYSDGFSSSGRGDVYITSKIQMLNPDDHHVGVSITSLVEILGDMALSDTTLGLQRVNWALPVSVQVGNDTTQAFLTTGYFSRGAIFAGLGLSHALMASGAISIQLGHAKP